MISARQLIYGSLVLTLVVFSSWYLIAGDEKSSRPSFQGHLPDVIVENMTAIEFDEQGAPKNTLHTPKLVHYPSNNSSDVIKPDIVVFKEDEEPWHIHSEHGRTYEGSNVIRFWEKVVLEQKAGEHNKSSTITTRELFYFTDKSLAKTDHPITIKQPELTIESKGMMAHLDQSVSLFANPKEKHL